MIPARTKRMGKPFFSTDGIQGACGRVGGLQQRNHHPGQSAAGHQSRRKQSCLCPVLNLLLRSPFRLAIQSVSPFKAPPIQMGKVVLSGR